MGDYLLLIVSAILVSNIVLARYLGNCPFLGVSQKMDTAVGMGMAVIFVVTLAGMITWVVQYAILNPLGLEYLRTIAFILVIASLVQLVEMFLQKSVPALYKALGIFLPLITTNCAVLGIAIINIQEEFNFMQTVVFSFASAVGFSLAMVLLASLRERFPTARIPSAFAGMPIAMITVGLLALAFLGFTGLTG
ncbi:MAG: electron transport complex subunit RsxA [Deltaproteobacteria bacterium]|jgi:electron transport complex protein RnfA|nr:electron transport complex subunit RsxA [Deltaproteobacteria bacterium]PNV87627.1 MAG: electron transport complex subunit RsxA [Desulfobacteraceae bacterium]MDH3802451.1 electron transport complex subunit RsxA [Deltaproteobacteria bacterium]MDH3897022.1 electron transport complex subunit RsxA [Deltaproteobacteria bacterium]MDH3950648.1 electron transport complex subunit RsxA [Deltaproteobacteria bacterium]